MAQICQNQPPQRVYSVARETQDEDNVELISILRDLINENVDITAREIVRRHSSLSSASSITRNAGRRQLVGDHQRRQLEMRQWQLRLTKQPKGQIAQKLAMQQIEIADLNHTVQNLVIGHLALIAAVAQVGGVGKLAKFYDSFREVRDKLSEHGAIPAEPLSSEIIEVGKRKLSTKAGEK